jgi:carbonic anhydrase/acetyltransferase-like protein (isoleucine patch superfamily)
MKHNKPDIASSAYISDSAIIIGDVTIGPHCGIYPNAVIRGDENRIIIEEGSNIQDCCVIHVDETHQTHIGKQVSIGHMAMVHGATIEDNCLIGIHATVLNGAVIKKGSIIGANALVTSDTVIPENSLVLGVPGKAVKQDPSYQDQAIKNAEIYRQITKEYIQKKYPFYFKK